ncbi:MAG: hypothetical protein NVS3B16_04660 [Vulcanimicrobiaceae bacterium]
MEYDLSVSRIIPASPAEVFDVWLDSASPGSLWSGSERLIIDPVVDGLFYIVFEHEGRLWPHYGRFVHIDRPHRIEHTWVSEATRGLETIVTCTLQSRGDRTEILLQHTGLPDAAAVRQHEGGWTSMLSALHDHLALQAATAQRAT